MPPLRPQKAFSEAAEFMYVTGMMSLVPIVSASSSHA